MDIKYEPPNAADDDMKLSTGPVVTTSSGQIGQIMLTCVKCKQRIPLTDRFFNLPTNASRRRIWCDRLGFNFNLTMVKHKSWNAKPICTRHFAPSELSTYTTKSKMERCGYPLVIRGSSGQRPHIKSLRVKRQPWPCTMCSFSCFSVAELFEHVSQSHLTTRKTKAHSIDGYACPFCRRCAYGYRTLSGFERHMSFNPTQHFLLHKIVESATAQGREGYLVPVDSWAAWTEENVAMALFGFVPKQAEKKAPELVKKEMSLDEIRVRRAMLSNEARHQLLANKSANSMQSATAILTESVPLSLDFLNSSEEPALNMISVSLGGPSSDYQTPASSVSNQQLVAKVKKEVVSHVAAANGPDADFTTDASGGISATSIMTQGRGDLHFAPDVNADDNDDVFASAGSRSEMEPAPQLTLADMLPIPDQDAFVPAGPSSTNLLQPTGGDTVPSPAFMPTINPMWARRQLIVDKMMTRKLESAENRRKFFGPIDVDADSAESAPRPLVARLTIKATPSRLLAAPSNQTTTAPAESSVIGSDCPVCSIRFFSDGALRKHMFGVHGQT